MKIHIIVLAALLFVPAGAVLHAEGAPKQSHEDTELEKQMDTMGQAWKKLKRQVADPAMNAESLKLLLIVRGGAGEAVKLIPEKAADLPAGDRAKFVADYQAAMKKLLAQIDALETALKTDKNDLAAKLVKEIGAIQKEGHKQFKRPDDEK